MSCVEQVLYRRQIVPMTVPQEIEAVSSSPDPEFFNGHRYRVKIETTLNLPAAKHCRGMKSVFLVKPSKVDSQTNSIEFVPTAGEDVWYNGVAYDADDAHWKIVAGPEYALECDGFRWFVSVY